MDDGTTLFRSNSAVRQADELELRDFVDLTVWVAWRNEYRRSKSDDKDTITKVPYSTPAREARSNDPATWRTLDGATEVAEKIDTGVGAASA